MNRSKRPIAAKARKKMNKEIHKAETQALSAVSNDDTTPKKLLSRYPKKTEKKLSVQLKGLEKAIDLKKKKPSTKLSKRTTPGTVDQVSAPNSSHKEGKRWKKTIAVQIKTKTQEFSKKTAKRSGK